MRVPEGWKKSKLSEKLLILKDGTHYSPQSKSGSFMYLTSKNIRFGKLDISNVSYISEEEHKKIYKGSPVKNNDLLLTKDGANTGNAALNTIKDEFSLLSSVAYLRGKPNVLLNEFLLHLILSPAGQSLIKSEMAGQAITRLTLKKIGDLQFLFPSYPEQQKISQILSTWDKAIEKLEALITAKKKRKKALMQQLLTGKKRFPEFEREWKEYKLGELCHFKRGKGLSKEMLISDGKYKCILYGELYTKYDDVIGNVVSRTNEADSIKSIYGDVLIPSSTTTSGIDLANAVALLEDDVLLGGDINILRPNTKKVCSEFLAYLLTHIKKHQIASKAQGATIIHLYGSDLKPLLVKLPDIKEQQKIATVLSAADKEIAIHQKQLLALKEQKKGLMQQLLTGKKRVKVDQVAA